VADLSASGKFATITFPKSFLDDSDELPLVALTKRSCNARDQIAFDGIRHTFDRLNHGLHVSQEQLNVESDEGDECFGAQEHQLLFVPELSYHPQD
jgi:hypothetical protein